MHFESLRFQDAHHVSDTALTAFHLRLTLGVSSIMSESGVPVKKRKNPPTFHHLPINRGIYIDYNLLTSLTFFRFSLAATLKKAWIQKTKIKTKWKAQKRKEGLDQSSKLDIPIYEDEDIEETPRDGGDSSENEQDAKKSPRTSKPIRPQASVMHPSRAHIHPTLPVKKHPPSGRKTNDSRPAKRQRTGKVEEPAEPPLSLRELTKQAYSRETLHTYKADPLKKHHGALGRGGSAARGRGPATGRGQPNMKLRMNAMLEKIKQDVA